MIKIPKHIRFYTETPKDKIFDKNYPDREGIIHFKDNDTIKIETEMDGKYRIYKNIIDILSTTLFVYFLDSIFCFAISNTSSKFLLYKLYIIS